jgi:Na+/H+ antiporter NhaD/arsenite permease-like protein
VVERRQLEGGREALRVTTSALGIAALAIFALAYVFVIAEERVRLKKSTPVMIAAGVIWILTALAYGQQGRNIAAVAALEENLRDFGELFLFLLSAVTFVNTMEERQVFDALRARIVARRFTLRGLFWITGLIAFLLSPVLDNLTTALVVGAVALAIAGDNKRFVTLACVNIVVAANAGGAFSPFGDITTLMVWQHGAVRFGEFFKLFLPALVNWVVPAALLSIAVGSGHPPGQERAVAMRPGARGVIALFAATIALTVLIHGLLDLPAVLGMMTGLGLLKLYSQRLARVAPDPTDSFDIFQILQRVEWDTFMFFYGVILCVGGLGALGYLGLTSRALYEGLGATSANVIIGILSAIVDNIPLMFAVLQMHPEMSHNQWLLITLTAGVGGSLLSIGSAAGVALMGQARGSYTFKSHLRYAWAIALGYVASVGTHLLINGR